MVFSKCTCCIEKGREMVCIQGAPMASKRTIDGVFIKCTCCIKEGLQMKCFQRTHIALQIVAKVLEGQRYPSPLCEYKWMCDSERGSGPKGANDLS